MQKLPTTRKKDSNTQKEKKTKEHKAPKEKKSKMKKIIVYIFTVLFTVPTLVDVASAGAVTITNKGTNPAAKATETDAKNEAKANAEKKAAASDSEAKKKITTNEAYNKAVSKREAIKEANKKANAEEQAKNKTPGTANTTEEESEEEKTEQEKKRDKANATLEAASIATMGIGTMEVAQALSEKKSDAAAERDMTAYLATMRCEWGRGNNSKLSNKNIEIGNGNELIKYVTEYKTLAARLKKTKTALKMTPGLESQEIIDKAESTLYEYTPAVKGPSNFGSLANALRDENSEDAEKLAEQKKQTKTRLIAGAAVAGAGLVGSIVGNQLINKDAKKDENSETTNEDSDNETKTSETDNTAATAAVTEAKENENSETSDEDSGNETKTSETDNTAVTAVVTDAKKDENSETTNEDSGNETKTSETNNTATAAVVTDAANTTDTSSNDTQNKTEIFLKGFLARDIDVNQKDYTHQDPGSCDVTNRGDWCANFGESVIKGVSTCQKEYSKDKDLPVGATDGEKCCCKTTSPKNSKWQCYGPSLTFTGGDTCATNCASQCAYDMSAPSFRKKFEIFLK